MRIWTLHLFTLAVLAVLLATLPPYHATNLARILVLAVFAIGYNLAFGYTGLLSLGHALFFAAGVYGAALPITYLGLPQLPALVAGLLAGGLVAGVTGLLALRTAGVSFMIVTLMFAQAGYLTLLYFGPVTGGDEGLVLPDAAALLPGLSADVARATIAYALFSAALLSSLALVQSRLGRTLVAIRENEDRSRMLGYNTFAVKLTALVLSGLFSGAAGAAYALLFGYAGASFATIQYSILPMLWVLMGGAGTVLGPLVGTAAMFYLVDIAGSYTTATLLFVGVALVLLILFAPKGILGTIRERWLTWLP
ncbi:branched-chain amino acid ABC transporter permease [Rhodobacteraceae bacterium HSP-20]|uniref:Branched-chain amino acid ABC transporter permease n=1 Tax=Paragemmobacter amnigenus TaxID=2852097 RepID=A0ABS6IZQ3_9RHOB|nr:branched-chain amino acid ABC transporter permease [Rhodobacter amnigenus]MBU9697001.1 branched-chain amino acid ABC transporter permease [Rhodobacter amnigenus]MBV4388228.1 branched-chain amino acid ABC transporter permease [Rhodobacter amnigenus]